MIIKYIHKHTEPLMIESVLCSTILLLMDIPAVKNANPIEINREILETKIITTTPPKYIYSYER